MVDIQFYGDFMKFFWLNNSLEIIKISDIRVNSMLNDN